MARPASTERQRLGVGVVALLVITALTFAGVSLASDANVASVADTTAPTGEVTLAPGGSSSITINFSVTGKQDGTATFKVNRDWTLSGGTWSGSNPQQFTVSPRAAGDPATTFQTNGSVSVDAGQTDGPFPLSIGVFAITNSNTTGAKLAVGASATYSVTVETPAPTDTTPPSILITSPGDGATYTLNQPVTAEYTCWDELGGSGLNSCVGDVPSGDPIDTAHVGSNKTFSVNAEDNAGNKSNASVTYNIDYWWTGFLQPVNDTNHQTGLLESKFKLGSTVPLKFQLKDYVGNVVQGTGTPAFGRSSNLGSCDASTSTETVDSDPATASFRYDSTAQQWIYTWSTKGLSKGEYRVWVTLDDGTGKDQDYVDICLQ